MKWIFIILIIIVIFLLSTNILTIVRLKNRIIESKLGLSICIKRKDSVIERIIKDIREKDPEIISKPIYKQLAEYSSIIDTENKINAGKNITKDVFDEYKTNLHLVTDGELSYCVDELKNIDEKILNFEKKYNMSILAYEKARKKSILFFLFSKHKKSDDITNYEEWPILVIH